MRRYLLIPLLAASVFAWQPLAATATPSGPQQVEIPQGEHVLHGLLFRPAGTGPFAAIVALHGCEGLSARPGRLRLRYRDWGERLSKSGLAVLYPDSYSSRGLGPQCSARVPAMRVDRERVEDANAARRWLQRQSWAVSDRIALLGWSSGGAAALWAVRPQAAPKERGPDFRSAVALYPGCRRLADLAWSARVPTLILIGGADDWTPADACQRMVAGARGRSAQATIVVYPGAPHGFDEPNRPLQARSGVAYSANGSGQVHHGTNLRARTDALHRVMRWLAR